MADLPPGITQSSRYPVTAGMSPPHLAPAQVLGTSTLVELMERTALESIAPHLAPGETSVGARIDVRHLRPAFPGEVLVVDSRLVEVGRRLCFEVTVSVGDRVVGTAWHERVVVERSRFGGEGPIRCPGPALQATPASGR